MSRKNIIYISILTVVVIIAAAILYKTLCVKCMNLEAFKPESIKNYILSFGPWALIIFILLYALNTVTLLPPIGIMSLSAGAILGPLYGTVGVMAGSFLGTTITFFIARKVGGSFVQKMIKGKAKEFQDKLDKNGFKVILLIRLLPVLPWEVVNYASGLSKIKYRDYIIATLIGIFPAVLIQVYFSHSAANFDIKDPKVWIAIIAFILLLTIPGIYLKKKRMVKMKYNYDLIVIGGGAAGLTASTGAGGLGAKTLLIEKEKELGGDCLHYGCVPSKSLIKSAYCYNILNNSKEYGLPSVNVPKVDFRDVRERINNIISKIQEHDSPEHIKEKYNVDTKFGQARFVDSHTIVLDGENITARNFIICTGSSPSIPPVEGLNDVDYITNKEVFYLDNLPSSLIVLGGGPIGMEMAQAFNRLGSDVTVIQSNVQLLPKEDIDVAGYVRDKLESEGITVHLNSRAEKVEKDGGSVVLTFHDKNINDSKTVKAEAILVSTGRRANVDGLDLEKAGVQLVNRAIRVDDRLRTTAKNIYACGDVNGGYQFTHVAGYEGGIAMVNCIMRVPAKVDYTNVPWCTYLDPEVASVGYNEKRAKGAGLEYRIQREDFNSNDRALAEGETEGFIKMLINKREKVVGVQIVGYHAGDLIHEWVAALNGKVSISTIAQSIHAYPTLSEISKVASGNILAPKFFNNKVKKILKLVFGLQGK